MRLGRFAWELYYTRTKAVLPREEVRRRAALVFGHLGYITGVFEYVMTDMFWLRFFALSGCTMIVGFQMAQPKIQWLSAGWNTVYSVVNIYQIYLLERRLPALTEESAALFEALGGESKLQPKQFARLLEVGAWRFLDAGEKLKEQGSDATLLVREVCLISAGSCDVFLGDLVVAHLGPGSVVGEVGALALDPATSSAIGALCRPLSAGAGSVAVPRPSATVVAREGGLRCLCVPLDRLEKEPELRDALQGIFASALGEKVLAMNQESRSLQYAAVLEMACHPGVRPDGAVATAISAFRRRHSISDEEHSRAFASLTRRCTESALLGLVAPRAGKGGASVEVAVG